MEWKLQAGRGKVAIFLDCLQGTAALRSITMEEVCGQEEDILVLTAGMTRADDCVHACPKFKGSIGPPVLSKREANRLLQRLVQVRDVWRRPGGRTLAGGCGAGHREDAARHGEPICLAAHLQGGVGGVEGIIQRGASHRGRLGYRGA